MEVGSLTRRLFYLFATLIIVCAVVASILNWISPILNQRRATFEGIVSNLIGAPVTIKEVAAGWSGYHPQIQFYDVRIQAKPTAPLLQIKQVGVSVAIWKSLWQRHFVPSGYFFSGTTLNLTEQADGRYLPAELADLALFQPSATPLSWQDGVALLGLQPRIQVQKIRLNFLNRAGLSHAAWLKTLDIRNSENEHTVYGSAVLYTQKPVGLGLALRWQGDVKNLPTLFVHGEVGLSALDITEMQDWLLLIKDHIDSEHYQQLQALQAKGHLTNLRLLMNGRWGDAKFLGFRTQFSELTWQEWGNLPGVSGLTGDMSWLLDQGQINFASDHARLKVSKLFVNELPLDQVVGSVRWQKDLKEQWNVQFDHLKWVNKEIAATLDGALSLPKEGGALFNLTSDFNLADVKHIQPYLPTKVFSPDLTEWLSGAFLNGSIRDGHAVIKGSSADFPFENGRGEFAVTGRINNIDLHFAPDWLPLKHLQGQLSFIGRKMIIKIQQANLSDIVIGAIDAQIPYLGDAEPQILTVQAPQIKTDLATALTFVHASPLQKTLGKLFANLSLSGASELNLHLVIPLAKPDDLTVQGNLAIQEGELSVVPVKLSLSSINGNVAFTEDTTSAKGIQATLFNEPFTLNLDTLPGSGPHRTLRAQFNTAVAFEAIKKWQALEVSGVSGKTNVAGTLLLAVNAPKQLQLGSDLVGIQILKPKILAKSAASAQATTLSITVPEVGPLLAKVNYGKNLSVGMKVEREREKNNVTAAEVAIGGGTADVPNNPGLYIKGNFDDLSWNDIKPYWHDDKNSLNNKLSLKQVWVNAKRFTVGSVTLANLALRMGVTNSAWDIVLNSTEIEGQLSVPQPYSKQGAVTCRFKRITLTSNASNKEVNVRPSELPPLIFSADQLQFNNMRLGQFSFRTQPTSNGLTLNNLRMSSNNALLTGRGDWSNSNVSRISGDATSNNVSAFLTDMGVDARNFVASRGDLQFNLRWQGSPFSPALASLDGTARIQLGKGRIVEVGPGSAKMGLGQLLSIFSLQSLPRRLSLDFSDIFQKGYSFDKMQGDFNINDGSMRTTNLYFDGPVAKLNISGRIGLKNKDLNLVLAITPYVTSSLPIAATIITGNPLVGVGALAVSSLLNNGVAKMANYQYAVTGSWNDPTWTSVGAQKSPSSR